MAPSEPPDASNEHGPQPAVSDSGGLPIAFSLEPLAAFDPSSVSVTPVEPVDQLYGRFGGRCFLLRGALTPEECRYLISEMSSGDSMEQVKYRHEYRRNDRCIFESRELADVLWSRVRSVAETLAIRADPAEPERQRLLEPEGIGEAEELEDPPCPDELRVGLYCGGVWRPTGLNECLRFCRYNSGGFFRAHCDATFRRSDDEMSLFTCMFYLDGGFGGGATRFLKIDSLLTDKTYLQPAAEDQVLASVVPEPGLCVLFFQPGLLHEGMEVLQGSKHILRTEVMFRRDAGSGPKRTPREEEAWGLAREAQEAEAAGECDRACQLYRRAFKMDPKLERAF